MQNYLPEALEGVRNVISIDRGNVFSRSFLREKKSLRKTIIWHPSGH